MRQDRKCVHSLVRRIRWFRWFLPRKRFFVRYERRNSVPAWEGFISGVCGAIRAFVSAEQRAGAGVWFVWRFWCVLRQFGAAGTSPGHANARSRSVSYLINFKTCFIFPETKKDNVPRPPRAPVRSLSGTSTSPVFRPVRPNHRSSIMLILLAF